MVGVFLTKENMLNNKNWTPLTEIKDLMTTFTYKPMEVLQ